MNISPALGIGDLLIWKMYCKSNNIEDLTINVNTKLIDEYRLYPQKYIKFIDYLIKMLFKDVKLNYIYENINISPLPNYIFNCNYLFDNININKKRIIDGEYIVLHTKCRIDYYQNQFDKEIPILNDFLSKFKTNLKLVLIGEKYIEECKEAKLFNIKSLYENYLLLKDNNNIIDLTKDFLYSGNDEIDDFLNDLNIINNAKYNVTFGYGGPLNLCQAFSKNNICYVGEFDHPVLYNYQNNNNNLYRNINQFIDKIKSV